MTLPKDYKFREVYLLSVAAEDENYVDKNAAGGVHGWVDCFEKAEFKFICYFIIR